MTAVMWFRGDLRVADNVALHAALEHERMIPMFCLDHRLIWGRHSSAARTRFMVECLEDLDRSLRARGSGLAIRSDDPQWNVVTFAINVRATEVHATAAATPYARRRDQRVREALRGHGIELCLHPGAHAVDRLSDLRTTQGRPYTVFTPFHRAWLKQPRRPVLPAPRELPEVPVRWLLECPPSSLRTLWSEREVGDRPPGGETAARRRLSAFLRTAVGDYETGRDEPARDGTSRLSPYLHFGCISPRSIEERIHAGPGDASGGAAAFRRQLCWRDFHHHVVGHFPANARREFQTRYRGTLAWSESDADFAAWCEGRTGYPLVDAGMRQLRAEGWMHNRIRLVVGSFLTKDLGLDWRRGEAHFMSLLLDGDEADNNGNWQWIASVGVDPQPVVRRIYNPTLQQRRLDPRGEYVRRYVPELRHVPDEHIAEPWRMSSESQRAAGCVIGTDYPAPIVDHAAARREALARYRAAAELSGRVQVGDDHR